MGLEACCYFYIKFKETEQNTSSENIASDMLIQHKKKRTLIDFNKRIWSLKDYAAKD